MNQAATVSNKMAFGVMLVSMATLALELVLTRIWSVLAAYHLAFMAVSLAMFGLTAGALLVYLRPDLFAEESTKKHLAASALMFSISIIFSFLTQLCIPLAPSKSIVGIYQATLVFGVAAIPFCFSGICLTLAFTRFTEHIGRLYAYDLVGAASACVLLALWMAYSDGPSTVFFVAAISALGALAFSLDTNSGQIRKWSIFFSIALFAFALTNAVLAHEQKPLIRFLWTRGIHEEPPVYEKWNEFSRITVTGDPNEPEDPDGWGLSSTFKPAGKLKQLWLNLDSYGQTPITEYSGDCSKLDFLKYDVSNIVYYLRSAPRVLIIGVGGGRDVLSALCFGAKSVLAVDINPDIIDTVNYRFGDLSGHLNRDKRVKFVAEDARSYVTRCKGDFDLIEMSIIDTGVLSASGALSLTESSLYTVEAWQEFLKHLSPGGILSCTRWYSPDQPGEIDRLVAVARSALFKLGVADPRQNIVVVRAGHPISKNNFMEAASVLVSTKPFTAADLQTISDNTSRLKFKTELSPQQAENKIIEAVAMGTADGGRAVGTEVNLEPPTDDSPFFFFMLRPADLFLHSDVVPSTGAMYVKGEFILAELQIAVLLLTICCLIIPLWRSGNRSMLKTAWPFVLFFTSIGLGYVLVEISQMQRLVVFLGHPAYSLTVVLFTLLMSSGIGSYLTSKFSDRNQIVSAAVSLAVLLMLLVVYLFATPQILETFKAAEKATRMAVSIAILFPLGFFMGMAFPFGFSAAAKQFPDLKPWLWGVNGAASVCGSVLSVTIAIGTGLTAAYLTGAASYLIALLSLLVAYRRK